MSEPFAALIKLQIDRKRLVEWLRSPPSPATRWGDWEGVLGARWSFDTVSGVDGRRVGLFATALDEANRTLATYRDNHAVLSDVLASAPAPQARIAALSISQDTFVAGSLIYSESLEDFIVFLAMARGAADFLAPAGYGSAVIQNVIFGNPGEEAPVAALRMMPCGESRFLSEGEGTIAGQAFQEIADAMLEERAVPDFPVCDQLDDLR